LPESSRLRKGIGSATLGLLLSTVLFSQESAPPATSPEQVVPAPPANPSEQAAPVPATDGTLLLSISGNRQFCVDRNEIPISESARKPREKRNSPTITTMGYKYQISVSRRGGTGVTKLFESPMIRTTFWEEPKKSQELPQPRLPTEKESKKPAKKTFGPSKIPRWMAERTCTTLLSEYRFPLAAGKYDVYLGFDLLGINGQWVPLESDFVTNLIIEAGKTSRVAGIVDHTEDVRTVKLEASAKTASAGAR
jgi:hypothetical protein